MCGNGEKLRTEKKKDVLEREFYGGHHGMQRI
jgi:hypothetical protein